MVGLSRRGFLCLLGCVPVVGRLFRVGSSGGRVSIVPWTKSGVMITGDCVFTCEANDADNYECIQEIPLS